MQHALSLIPAGASVSASYHLVPHLTDRKLIFSFPNPYAPRNWGINDAHQRDPKSVQWLIVETGDLQGDSDKKLLQSLLTGPNAMKTVYNSDGVILAARGN